MSTSRAPLFRRGTGPKLEFPVGRCEADRRGWTRGDRRSHDPRSHSPSYVTGGRPDRSRKEPVVQHAHRSLSATTKINRKDFGLTWNTALETGRILVGEDITITLDLEFV